MTHQEVASAVILGLLVNEATDLCPWVAARLVRWAARLRYLDAPERAAIRSEELARLVHDRPGKLIKLFTALGFALHALTFTASWAAARGARQFGASAIRFAHDRPAARARVMAGVMAGLMFGVMFATEAISGGISVTVAEALTRTGTQDLVSDVVMGGFAGLTLAVTMKLDGAVAGVMLGATLGVGALVITVIGVVVGVAPVAIAVAVAFAVVVSLVVGVGAVATVRMVMNRAA
jgi:hypothetical protein